jgi:hypothetical protein
MRLVSPLFALHIHVSAKCKRVLEDDLALFRHGLTPSYFTFNVQFYGQTDGVAMGLPFSPFIANL